MTTRAFLGWRVVAACVIGLACGIATAVVSTFGVFLGPVRASFGWSQSEAFAALLVITLVSAPLAPVVGGVVDRYGARRVVLASFVCEALIFASFALQGPSIWSFYARFVAFAMFGLATTHVAFARVITLWFDRRRGLALGVALSGIGIGGFLWPLFAQGAIEAYGWRCRSASVRAITGRSWRRSTIMSIAPFSSRNSLRWKPSGSFSRTVFSITRGPANPTSAFGSAMTRSPTKAKLADTPPIVGSVSTLT